MWNKGDNTFEMREIIRIKVDWCVRNYGRRDKNIFFCIEHYSNVHEHIFVGDLHRILFLDIFSLIRFCAGIFFEFHEK